MEKELVRTDNACVGALIKQSSVTPNRFLELRWSCSFSGPDSSSVSLNVVIHPHSTEKALKLTKKLVRGNTASK